MKAGRSPFWQTQPGLVWANPNASDSVHIRAALVHPQFRRLLEIAVEFGLSRLREEWAVLAAEGTPEAVRARPHVERILAHIQEGFARAAAQFT